MKHLYEKLVSKLWNRTFGSPRVVANTGLLVGRRVVDESLTGMNLVIPHGRRPMHIAMLGRTGTGKSSLLRSFCEQDVKARRGFFIFDIHGELTPHLLSFIAAEERQCSVDLSGNVIVIDPTDPDFSVGLNPLEGQQGKDSFVRVVQFADVLKRRWGLDGFGARTDELLRNSLLVLADNGLTLLDLGFLLTDALFRASCLEKTVNTEVREYFEARYGAASEPMQAVMREPILNKTSAFTADPHFRHIVGQRRSTFFLPQAMDEGKWIIANLPKGRLGPEAITLGALFLAALKHAAFQRNCHELFTAYADEVQNFIGNGADLETMLAETRKFGISICTTNQYLEQLPTETRAAILAVGTHVFFQLSPPDAQFVATALDGGRPLAERLKNLPLRHVVIKSGHDPLSEAAIPTLRPLTAASQNLYDRSRRRWAVPRPQIEAEITQRRGTVGPLTTGALNDWE